jgi:hypothetical protein
MSDSAANSADDWAVRLQGHVDACENCQPHEDGEVVWIEGEPQNVADFLYDKEAPEHLHELISQQLFCGQCGSSLELDTEIVADSASSQHDEEAAERFGLWVVEDLPQLNAFIEHLKQFPESGRNHQVGQELFSKLANLPTQTICGEWWRARALDASIERPTVSQLGPSPKPSATGGRFNSPGSRVFYLGSEKSAALSEAKKYLRPGNNLWVQQFMLADIKPVVALHPPPPLMNSFQQLEVPLVIAGLVWSNGLVQQREGAEQQAQYLLPQFIANCAAELGFRGILFNSHLHDGINIVLFSWDDEQVTAVGGPQPG